MNDNHTDGPSFCWSCGRKLKLPFFAEVTDQIGHVHRVHVVCEAREYRETHPLTVDYPDQWDWTQRFRPLDLR